MDVLCFLDNNDDDEGIRIDMMNFNCFFSGKFSFLVVILKEMLMFKNCIMVN